MQAASDQCNRRTSGSHTFTDAGARPASVPTAARSLAFIAIPFNCCVA